ncbi:MAG: Hsp70 family protein, partial [Ktedonobacterales bacterium]
MGAVVGIDLGTTYSVIAHINADGRPEAIPDAFEKTTTPSVVYFGASGPVVGAVAKREQAQGAQDVASFFKPNMGDPYFALSFGGRDYTAVDLSALVLAHLKAQAEAYLGTPVSDAVITVPAYFEDAQRRATMAAGRQASLNVLSIISEPTAAAYAYGLRPSTSKQNVLVYDLGGGTFDVSLVEITPSVLRVVATDGDHNLGGRNWDDRLVLYLQQQFQSQFGCDLADDDYNELLVRAEELKQKLSGLQSAEARVAGSGHVASYTVTREQFEELSSGLLERTEQLTENVLRAASLKWSDIDRVLPVGGSTRMPMVKTLIERISGKPPLGGIHQDEAVALGAAIQAAVEVERASNLRLGAGAGAATPMLTGLLRGRATQDVIAHSLGLIVESDDRARYLNSRLIAKNAPIPADNTRPFTMRLRRGGDTTLEVFLTQGETDDPQACSYIGCYEFTEFPSLSTPEATINITYAYDSNGIVNVAAVEQTTGQPLKLEIKPTPPDVPARFAGSPRDQRSREEMTLYLAFDLSGSMGGGPLLEAKKAAHNFVSQCDLKSTAIGIIAFSDSVHVNLKASHGEREITNAIDQLTCGSTGTGNAGDPFDQIHDLLHHGHG